MDDSYVLRDIRGLPTVLSVLRRGPECALHMPRVALSTEVVWIPESFSQHVGRNAIAQLAADSLIERRYSFSRVGWPTAPVIKFCMCRKKRRGMSGIPSYLRRTEDIKRLKTRSLYIQGADGALPGSNTIPVFGTAGNIQFSEIEVIGGDSLVVPGDLTVDGSFTVNYVDIADVSANSAIIHDLSVNSIWTNTETVASRLDIRGSAATLGGLSIGQAHGTHELDVSGHAFINSDGTASRSFTVPGVYTLTIPSFLSSIDVELIGAGGFASNGGGGGYIRGTVDISGFSGQTLTLQVGAVGSGLCTPSSSSYLTFLHGGPLLAIAGAGGNGIAGTALGVIAAGGGGGGGVFTGGIAAGGSGGISSQQATSGAGGTTVGGAAAASPMNVLVYQTPQPGQGRPIPDSYIEASGGTGGFNESCGPAGGSGYAGGGQGLWAATTGGTFLAGGGGGGSSFISTRVSNITSYAGGSVPSGSLTGFGRAGQNGCVRISYINLPSLQTTGDIVCGGDLRVDGNIKGPIDISGTLSVDILNVRQYINDTNHTTSISTDVVRALSVLVGTENTSIQPQATLDVSGNAKIRGDISCNSIEVSGATVLRSTLTTTGAATFNNGLQITAGSANVRSIEFATTSGTSGLYFDGLNLYFNGMMIEMTNPASYLLGMTAEYYRLPAGAASSFVPFARETYGDLYYTLTKTISPPTTNMFQNTDNYDPSLYLVVLSGWFKPTVTGSYVFTTQLQYGQYQAYSDYYMYINGTIISGPTSATNSARTLTAGVYYKVDVFYRFTMPVGAPLNPISTQPAFSWTPATGAMYTKG